MKLRILSVVLLALGVASAITGAEPPREARACGSAEVADLGALDPVDAIALRMSGRFDDDWDYRARDELLFLEPFRRERPKELDALWSFSYGAMDPPPVATAELDRALSGKDAAAKKDAAERFIAAWLASPPVPAVAQKAALIRAATAVDAAAAKDLFAIEASLVKDIPNGWRDDVRKKFSRSDARKIDAKIDAWLTKNPKHPLAGYAALWKVRTRYFAGDDAGAYEVIFAAPPALRIRALAEARYLLLHDVRPSPAQLDAQTDVAWVAGLADRQSIDEARFAKWWRLAESEKSRKASVSLQERLLHWVATRAEGKKLPASFPTEARSSTPFWGEMRAAGLIRSGDSAGALAQLAKLPANDRARPELEASAHLAARRPELAARVPGLPEATRDYLLSVLVSPAEIEKLAREGGAVGVEARRELAIRTGSGGDWRKAASIVDKDDPTRAAGFRKVADLRASKDVHAALDLARFLDGKAGVLLGAPDRPTYRAMSARYGRPQHAAESAAIEQAMIRGSERYQALVAYVDWIEKNPKAVEAKLALEEADATYNRLVNFSGDDTLFWGKYLPRSDLAKRLRAAGKAIRTKP